MTVTAILKEKGSTDVATVRGDATLADVIALLAQKRIGALVVSSDGAAVEGIVSERDIVQCLAKLGADALAAPATEAMTRDVKTCGMGERSATLLARMSDGRFRHLPVVENGRMMGLVSIGDVVKHRLDELEHHKSALVDMVKGF